MIHVDKALWLLMETNPTLNPYAGEIRMHLDRYNDRRWHFSQHGGRGAHRWGHSEEIREQPRMGSGRVKGIVSYLQKRLELQEVRL